MGMHRFLSLIKELTNSKLECQDIREYIKNIYQIANEIVEIGHKLKDPIVIIYILNELPESYPYFIVNLESQISTIHFQDLTARLIDEER